MTCPEPDPAVTIPESSWQGAKVPGFTYSEAAGREGDGGGEEVNTVNIYWHPHPYVKCLVRHFAHMIPLVKKKTTQAEVVRERGGVQSEGCKLERYINTHKGLCSDSVIITAACP